MYLGNNDYQGIKQTAKRVNRSTAWIKVLARSQRIEGAVFVASRWLIPTTWQAPAKRRGRPTKKEQKCKPE